MIFCRILHLLTIFIFFTRAQAAPAERNFRGNVSKSVCMNGAPEKNRTLIESFKANKDPLKLAYENARRESERAPPSYCEETVTQRQFDWISEVTRAFDSIFPSSQIPVQDTAADIQELSKTPYKPAALIKRECIAASMKRNPGNKGHTCSYPNPKEVKRGFKAGTQSVPKNYGAGGSTLQCMNDEMLDYLSFAVNSAIQCLSPTDPVDSRVIFQKFNNETAFNFTIGYSGGVGLGQITTPAAREVASDLGKGQYLLESVANSSKKSCAPFKEIAARDLKKVPSTSSLCSWLNPGNGLARNLLHGVGYYITMRDKYILPLLMNSSPKLAENRDLVSNLTAITYGAEGYKHARWLLKKHRVTNATNPTKLIQAIQKDSEYLRSIRQKTCEMYAVDRGVNLKPNKAPCEQIKLTSEEQKGDACVVSEY